jgi:hypothetical protein
MTINEPITNPSTPITYSSFMLSPLFHGRHRPSIFPAIGVHSVYFPAHHILDNRCGHDYGIAVQNNATYKVRRHDPKQFITYENLHSRELNSALVEHHSLASVGIVGKIPTVQLWYGITQVIPKSLMRILVNLYGQDVSCICRVALFG